MVGPPDLGEKGARDLAPLAAYVRLWAVSVMLRVLSRSGFELLYNEAVAFFAAIAFLFPLHPLTLLLSFGWRIAALVASLPYIHDSQHWCLHTDLAVAFAIISMLRQRMASGPAAVPLLARFSREEADVVAKDAASTVQFQYLLLYMAAALYKANTGFMHARYSCAPVFLLSLLEQNLPQMLLSPALLKLATQLAPSIILATETLVPVLFLLAPRCGVCFAALFHWAIAITPPPNDIASFGVQTLPRMLLLIPDLAGAAAMVGTVAHFGWQGAVVAAVAAATTALQPISYVDFDASVPICGALAAIICLASFASSSATAASVHNVRPNPVGAVGWILRLSACVYALVVIPLGVMDMGAANMFSSLRMHGGSNHYLLPTNLLQRLYMDAPADSLAGEIFGGGVVRVEGTNSSHIGPKGLRYPGELLDRSGDGCCRPSVVAMLRASGHSGRQWSPMAFSCAIGNQPMVSPRGSNASILSAASGVAAATATFERYTIPAPELRRMIRDARARYPDEAFDLSGVLLPGAEGDETWRATAAAARFVIRRRQEPSGGEGLTCVDEGGAPCDSWVVARLLAEPSGHWLAWLANKLLLQQPYPLVAGDEGAHRRVHCFGP